MEEKNGGFLIGMLLIGILIGFVFGAAHEEGSMKKIIKYCVNYYTERGDIFNCIQEALDVRRETAE